ncbi:30S ribosomal protein S9 [Pseudonocardia humida]|uniref:30S ribosomal protein S9 n=1 Tax=Pseudonocardia humida TaxID=2800819 RepID=UPI00207C8CBB|nr:30S ribosomal protein S9 [Pseudonocardia humida]
MTTPEPEIEAVEEAAVDAEATEIADAADDAGVDIVEADADAEYQDDVEDADVTDVEDFEVDLSAPEVPAFADRPIQTVGRRKEAVVRVRLMPGSGQFRLNGKSLEQYFPNKLHQQLIREPLVTVEKTERFDIFANLHGGGTSGQAGALRLAIARALIEADSEDRPPLKKAGFLTRDPRVIERKKYGLKKARKAPQYSKR